ncbi:hypothetical protein MTO96_018087 [Rhipicephalus appendiculatus]
MTPISESGDDFAPPDLSSSFAAAALSISLRRRLLSLCFIRGGEESGRAHFRPELRRASRCPAETPRPTARRQGALCPDSNIQCSGAGRLLGGGAAASAGQERQEECLPVTRIGTASLVLAAPFVESRRNGFEYYLAPAGEHLTAQTGRTCSYESASCGPQQAR